MPQRFISTKSRNDPTGEIFDRFRNHPTTVQMKKPSNARKIQRGIHARSKNQRTPATTVYLRTDEKCRALGKCLALSFRPGDRTATFAGKLLRTIGSSVAVLLSYEDDGQQPVLSGVRGRLQPDGQRRSRYGSPRY